MLGSMEWSELYRERMFSGIRSQRSQHPSYLFFFYRGFLRSSHHRGLSFWGILQISPPGDAIFSFSIAPLSRSLLHSLMVDVGCLPYSLLFHTTCLSCFSFKSSLQSPVNCILAMSGPNYIPNSHESPVQYMNGRSGHSRTSKILQGFHQGITIS
jgi:hypothetical protein